MLSARGVRRSILAVGLVGVIGSNVAGSTVEAGPSGGALNKAYVLELEVAGVNGVPADAVAVALNVTVADPQAPGFLAVYPCGEPEPLASNLNFVVTDRAIPNAVLAKVGVDGLVCISALTTVDVIVDISGYVPADSELTPLPNPERILDTRSGRGAPASTTGPGVLQLQVGGLAGIPADAAAVVVNTTVVGPSAPGFVTVFPCDQPLPTASNLNFAAGEIRPNLVIARLDPSGRVCLFSNTATHLVADAVAFLPAGASGFQSIVNPHRLADTRIGLGAPAAPITPTNQLSIQVWGVAGVPSNATTVAINVTATEGQAQGFITVHPCGAVPVASTLNYAAGQTIANLSFAAISTDGRVCLFSNVPSHLVVDLAGYFVGADTFEPLPVPVRLFDSRTESNTRCNQIVFPPNGSTIVVRDLASGVERPVSKPELTRALNPIMSFDCGGVLVVDPTSSGGERVVEHRFDGSQIVRGVVPYALAGGGRLVALSDGRIFVEAGGAVFDVASGVRLASPGGFYRPVGISGDGTLAAFVGATLFNHEVTYVNVSTNVVLGTFDLGAFGYDPTLSKDGSFLAFGLPWVANNGVPTEYPVITAFDGTVLDLYPAGPVPGPVRTNWITDDEVIVCIPGQNPVIWTIYGGLSAVGATSGSGCPTGA